MLLPRLGHPLGFFVAGALGAMPTFVSLAGRLGAGRAAALAAAIAVTLSRGFLALGYAVWAMGAVRDAARS